MMNKRWLLVLLLVVTAIAYSFSVSAQPATTGKDAGAPATSGSAPAAGKDGGPTTAGEGGVLGSMTSDEGGAGPSGISYIPTSKKWPPPPPPTPQQIAALEAMQKATDAYEQGARE